MKPALFDICRRHGPVGAQLPALSVAQASAQRLLFDARFACFLARLLGQTVTVAESARAPSSPAAVLTLESPHGRCRLVIPIGAWPALQLAMALDDKAQVCGVLTCLLAALLSRWIPIVGQVQVTDADYLDAPDSGWATLSTDSARVVLVDADSSLVRQLAAAMTDQVSPELGSWPALAMPARLVLMQHLWTWAWWRGLHPGDVVLEPAKAGRTHVVWVGQGIALTTRATLNLVEQTVTVNENLRVQQIPMQPDVPMPAHDWAEIELPISFELETARIPLADWAAMTPGCVLDMGALLSEAAVRVVCHGQTIGRGQLVSVGDQLGVRLTRLGITRDV